MSTIESYRKRGREGERERGGFERALARERAIARERERVYARRERKGGREGGREGEGERERESGEGEEYRDLFSTRSTLHVTSSSLVYEHIRAYTCIHVYIRASVMRHCITSSSLVYVE